jgi:dTDP-3-amino-3,4,6-trideoxy-alpha-D-glucose transaminase
VVTNDPELSERVRLLRSHGEPAGMRNRHRVPGTTARLDAVQAAVLRVKLRRLEEWNRERRRLGAALSRRLAGAPVALPAPPDGGDHVFHLYVIRTDARDELRERLARSGVASAIHYPVPIHLTEAYADLGLARGSLPAAERRAETICSLPLFPAMSEDELERVASAVEAGLAA